MWFEKLTGFQEDFPDRVRERLVLEGDVLTSKANGRRMRCGRLEIPSLGELREQVGHGPTGRLRLREVLGDVRTLHTDAASAGAVFQVASQFNLLEMIGPEVTPEAGIDIYENDPTQGPACAVACGAGTIYRNYFVPVDGRTGQSAHHQVDCLRDLGEALGNERDQLWEMRNGYALATPDGQRQLLAESHVLDATEWDELRALVRVGIQWDTEVTLRDAGHTVSQVYCAALPVTHLPLEPGAWSVFGRLILEAAYEATFLAALLNAQRTGDDRLYLTWLGGGAFGTPPAWIADAIRRCLELFADRDLDVAMVSYHRANPAVAGLLTG